MKPWRVKPWQAFAAIVPAGLLLGAAGGNASRPEMQFNELRPWPQSVTEHGERIEQWRPIYAAGPANPSPAAYSYRPEMDYSARAFPPQEAIFDEAGPIFEQGYVSREELTAAGYPAIDPGLPTVHRESVERIADRAVQAASEATEAAHHAALAADPAATSNPPEIAKASTVPAAVAPIETEAF